jgi:hypothetical protein
MLPLTVSGRGAPAPSGRGRLPGRESRAEGTTRRSRTHSLLPPAAPAPVASWSGRGDSNPRASSSGSWGSCRSWAAGAPADPLSPWPEGWVWLRRHARRCRPWPIERSPAPEPAWFLGCIGSEGAAPQDVRASALLRSALGGCCAAIHGTGFSKGEDARAPWCPAGNERGDAGANPLDWRPRAPFIAAARDSDRNEARE